MTADLPLFTLVQLHWTSFAVFLGKWIALRSILPQASLSSLPGRLLWVLTYDFLLIALVALLAALAHLIRLPSRGFGRWLIAGFTYLVFSAWTIFSFANAGFLVTMGEALDWDMLTLAPHLAGYLLKSLTGETMLMTGAAAALTLFPLFLTPTLLRLYRPQKSALFAATIVAALGAFAWAATRPIGAPAEGSLRQIFSSSFLPTRAQTAIDAPPPSSEQAATMKILLGGPRHDGEAAFASLPRRPYNVLMVVWESVGERYLKSHPLGSAETPNLDALIEKGSVRFRNAYAICPLSVESIWSFFTGIQPPAKPAIFLDPTIMPAHGRTLPDLLKEQGYRTSVLIGSYTRSWGADRIIRLGGVDLFEDIQTLSNRGRFAQQDWSIDGRAINERFWTWLDGTPSREPFFSVIWNVETHFPYSFQGMTPEDEALGKEHRFVRSIEHADRLLGELVAQLDQRGLRDDTLIVVVGDHGEGTGRPPHTTRLVHGFSVYEDSMHVPLVFINPALGKPRTVSGVVSILDVYPTILDLVGLTSPTPVSGKALSRPYAPDPMIMHTVRWWPAAIRSGPYKFIRASASRADGLFNIEDDPRETIDLSQKHPEIAATLDSYLLYESAQRQRFDPSMNMDAPWPQTPAISSSPVPVASPR